MNPALVTNITFLVIKLMIVIGIGLYTVFAGIMVRQEQLMSKVMSASLSEPILRLFTIVHFLASIFVLLSAIVLL